MTEEKDGRKELIPFQVEDGRLRDPANTLAVLAVNKIKKFTVWAKLSEAEKQQVRITAGSNILTEVPLQQAPPMDQAVA